MASSPLLRSLGSFRKQTQAKQNGGAAIDLHITSNDETLRSSADVSFATDLLFNLDDVRADCADGLAAHGNLVALLKSRINLERTYAHELNKMAKYSRLDEMEHGTMKTALGSLKALYLNTSVQHQHLASSLEEDVLKPIEMLYSYNIQRAQNLTRHVNNVKKEARAQEDAYRRDYNVFDKNFRDASAAFSAAMDTGISSTLLEDQYHWRLAQMEYSDNKTDPNSTGVVQRSTPSSLVAMKTINSSHKLVNWLLSSDNHRKEDLAGSTVKLMEAAEQSRRKCLQSWQDVETNRIEMYRDVQVVLKDYQQIAENRIFTIATNLRKHVVFASSALANEQYDWQAIASKFESVDLDGEICDFIMRCQRARGSEDRPHLSYMTVNDLCNAESSSILASQSSKPCRPLRKSCLEIRDISSKKVPFDYDGNQELLCEALGARYRTSDKDPSLSQPASDAQLESSSDTTTVHSGNSITSTKVSEQNVSAPPEVEDKQKRSLDADIESLKTQQGEPEHDSDESSPSVSPSGSISSLATHFLQPQHAVDGIVAQERGPSNTEPV